MESSQISSYIKKLYHPLKEIRERSLKLLNAKLKLGWILEDELSGTRELIEALITWFNVPNPTLQKEALELLLSTVKTKPGNYIVKEFGITEILSTLHSNRHKIEKDAFNIYEDVKDALKFLNTVQSEDNLAVPQLDIPSLTSSESGRISSSGSYNLACPSSRDPLDSSEENEVNQIDLLKITDGIKVILFPWVELCSSDSKTMLLIEDALKLFKSTRRCCRFIRNVFLRDFPPEIFLNRPGILQILLAMSNDNNGVQSEEALLVLLYITKALCKRLQQLTSLDLIHDSQKISEDSTEMIDNVNVELEEIAGNAPVLLQDDSMEALKQMPAPLYALDTLHCVLSIVSRSFVLENSGTDSFNLKELNVCLDLIESLINLLLDCVTERFWSVEHHSKILKDIAHKSCMMMRLLGDLLTKCRKLFAEDVEKIHLRVVWFRLVVSAERILRWAQESALPPSSLTAALQAAQLDPSLDLFYPAVSKRIALVLQKSRVPVDQEFKNRYKELNELVMKMDDAVKFMKNKNSCRNSKDVLSCIQNSLPVLELHLSEAYVTEVADIILNDCKYLDFNDNDWSVARNIALALMSHRIEWVQIKFYSMMADMVRSVILDKDTEDTNIEKCLLLLYDVSVLSEICCHGMSSNISEVNVCASEIMLYLLRGRLALSESSWWRLIASLLPILPLLHVYAAHETQLGKAICKSLEPRIAECMGVSVAEVSAGLVRLLFVRCVAVQLDAAHALCRLLDDDRYLPPKESLRPDVLMNALRRIEPTDFNVESSSSPSKCPQTTGLIQVLDVLKQDIVLDENGLELIPCARVQPALDASLRRSALQQLAVMMRQAELHDTFLQSEGLRVVVAILRMSLMVDDYLAFPECAISCVSVLNSVCFISRHSLAKIPDLFALLIRVILVFPDKDSSVCMCAQVASLVAWSAFALQAAGTRARSVALPAAVTDRAALPFRAASYWTTSPNALHSSVEWLLSCEEWRSAARVRWWCAWAGGGSAAARGAALPPAPAALRPAARDAAALRAACPTLASASTLLHLENATSHKQVLYALCVLESYIVVQPLSSVNGEEFASLPWHKTQRFLNVSPASPRDTALVISLLQFIIHFMDNIDCDGNALSWILSSVMGEDATVIALLSRDHLYPQQTTQESVEVTQLHIYIVKVLLRCVLLIEKLEYYNASHLESLLKILLVCLERLDLRNFHMLGYLNELMRCIRYTVNCRHCVLSEECLVAGLRGAGRVLARVGAGARGRGARKGDACSLDALLALLPILKQINDQDIPVQRWSDSWEGEAMGAVASAGRSACPRLRAAALHVLAALVHYAPLHPHILHALGCGSVAQYAAGEFARRGEASAVRAAAAHLLTAVTSRTSPHCDVLETEVLKQLQDNNFSEHCLEILVEYCNDKDYECYIEPNIPLSVLERRSQLEVLAQKAPMRVCARASSSRVLGACSARAPPSDALVERLADALHNVLAFAHAPVQLWNDQGLFRMLFRCASSGREVRARTAARRALVAAAMQRCVRVVLAATKDCLHDLLITLKPFTDLTDVTGIHEYAQALLLLGLLLPEKSAIDFVWQTLKEKHAAPFFNLILQCLEYENEELRESALFCVTHLFHSTRQKKYPDQSKFASYIEFFDHVKSRSYSEADDRRCSGDNFDDCRPEYMAEELTNVLIRLYHKYSLDNELHYANVEGMRVRVWVCVSAVLGASARARSQSAHATLPRALAGTLALLRDRLAVHDKPAQHIRNADNNPVLRSLYWVLIVTQCSMVECRGAKESVAEEGVAVALTRLWPWIMMTEQLRYAVTHLLYIFCNDCPKAWSAMCSCVGGRSLVGELCALAAREAALPQRDRPATPTTLLPLLLHTLRRCFSHHQCRAIVLKSEAMVSVYKMCMRRGGGGAGGTGGAEAAAGVAWAALARHAEGAGALLALRPPPALAPRPLRARLLPALAHAAHHHPHVFIHSAELVELLSGTLLAGDTAEVVSAARAVWALAANNHKGKLSLRSAGVPGAVQAALQRCARSTDAASQRALQLLTYTNTVLSYN